MQPPSFSLLSIGCLVTRACGCFYLTTQNSHFCRVIEAAILMINTTPTPPAHFLRRFDSVYCWMLTYFCRFSAACVWRLFNSCLLLFISRSTRVYVRGIGGELFRTVNYRSLALVVHCRPWLQLILCTHWHPKCLTPDLGLSVFSKTTTKDIKSVSTYIMHSGVSYMFQNHVDVLPTHISSRGVRRSSTKCRPDKPRHRRWQKVQLVQKLTVFVSINCPIRSANIARRFWV